jgi:hypothetical protein
MGRWLGPYYSGVANHGSGAQGCQPENFYGEYFSRKFLEGVA